MLKVIIADDEPHICQLLEALIDWEAEGFTIAGFAGDGYETARLCASSRPDLLITDIRMPGLGGLELVKQLHEQMPSIYVIIITGYSQFQYAHQALRYGVVDYLLKPIRTDELLAALKHVKEKIHNSYAADNQRSEQQISLKSMQSIKENLLLSFLNEKEEGAAAFRNDSFPQNYRFEFQGNLWRLVQIEAVLAGGNDNLSAEDYLKSKIKEIFTEEFKDEDMELVFTQTSRGYFCLMNGIEQSFLEFDGHLQTVKFILQQILELFKGTFTIGVSNVCKTPGDLDSSVIECKTAVEHKIVEGKNQIIYFAEVPNPRYAMGEFISEEFEQKFRAAIAAADCGAVTSLIADLVSVLNLMSRKLPGTLIHQIYENRIHLFFGAMNVFGISEDSNYSEEQLTAQGKCFYNATAAFHYLSNIFRTVLSHAAEKKGEQSTKPIRMAQLYIDEHYMEAIQLNEVAERVGLAPSYLSSLFKKQVGKSLVEYLTHVRIQNAKQLLVDRERNIADIADEVGFVDVKYFIKRFKKVTGLTPNEYRKLFGNG